MCLSTGDIVLIVLFWFILVPLGVVGIITLPIYLVIKWCGNNFDTDNSNSLPSILKTIEERPAK